MNQFGTSVLEAIWRSVRTAGDDAPLRAMPLRALAPIFSDLMIIDAGEEAAAIAYAGERAIMRLGGYPSSFEAMWRPADQGAARTAIRLQPGSEPVSLLAESILADGGRRRLSIPLFPVFDESDGRSRVLSAVMGPRPMIRPREIGALRLLAVAALGSSPSPAPLREIRPTWDGLAGQLGRTSFATDL